MANTYSQITIQLVFVVKYRENIITKPWRDELHGYLTGILRNEGLTPLAVGGWLDHVHLLFGLPVSKNICDVARILKASSSKWINENNFVSRRFQWQEGYGAFSYSKDKRDTLIQYIINQEEHHKNKTFKKEYMQLLADFDIEYDAKYLFDFELQHA